MIVFIIYELISAFCLAFYLIEMIVKGLWNYCYSINLMIKSYEKVKTKMPKVPK